MVIVEQSVSQGKIAFQILAGLAREPYLGYVFSLVQRKPLRKFYRLYFTKNLDKLHLPLKSLQLIRIFLHFGTTNFAHFLAQ